MEQIKLLLADDERIERSILYRKLSRELGEDCEFIQAENGSEAVELFKEHHPQIAVLDIAMPELDGIEAASRIRQMDENCVIIFLTAYSDFQYTRQAIRLRALDYLTKPFHLAELNARIKSVIRRKQQDGELQLSLANLTIYPDKHSVYINGKEIVLNRKEFDLLYYFISNPNRLISKATLAESVWGDYIDQADNFDFIYSQVKNLRKKLKAAGAIPEIKAVYGFGYKMTDEE